MSFGGVRVELDRPFVILLCFIQLRFGQIELGPVYVNFCIVGVELERGLEFFFGLVEMT